MARGLGQNGGNFIARQPGQALTRLAANFGKISAGNCCHLLLQDVIVGVHAIDVQYVADRWANLGWRVYDILLLAFAFAHGVNGFRQVLNDFIHSSRARQTLAWVLFAGWLIISLIGAYAIIAGVGK